MTHQKAIDLGDIGSQNRQKVLAGHKDNWVGSCTMQNIAELAEFAAHPAIFSLRDLELVVAVM